MATKPQPKKQAKKKSSSAKQRATDATAKKKARALDGYVAVGTVTGACLEAGIDRKTWYRWLKADPKFEEHVESAREQVADRLEEVAIQRATARTDPSDTLLIFLMKGLMPEKYGDKATVKHSIGGPLVIKLNGKRS